MIYTAYHDKDHFSNEEMKTRGEVDKKFREGHGTKDSVNALLSKKDLPTANPTRRRGRKRIKR